jgi:hypothetical protein
VYSHTHTLSIGGGFQSRVSTFVLAEDQISGRVLRCEVFVDSIDRIEILTTTRSMYKEEDEVLQVQAFDAEGNLVGVEYRLIVGVQRVAVCVVCAVFLSFCGPSFSLTPFVGET